MGNGRATVSVALCHSSWPWMQPSVRPTPAGARGCKELTSHLPQAGEVLAAGKLKRPQGAWDIRAWPAPPSLQPGAGPIPRPGACPFQEDLMPVVQEVELVLAGASPWLRSSVAGARRGPGPPHRLRQKSLRCLVTVRSEVSAGLRHSSPTSCWSPRLRSRLQSRRSRTAAESRLHVVQSSGPRTPQPAAEEGEEATSLQGA